MPTPVGPTWIFLSFHSKNPTGVILKYACGYYFWFGLWTQNMYTICWQNCFIKPQRIDLNQQYEEHFLPKILQNSLKLSIFKHKKRWDGCHNQATSPKITNYISNFFVFLGKVWWGNAKFKWMFLEAPSDLCNEYSWVESTPNWLDCWGHDCIPLSPSHIHQISE